MDKQKLLKLYKQYISKDEISHGLKYSVFYLGMMIEFYGN